MLCFSEFVFEIGQDGPLSASHYNIIHLQQGVPDHVSETRFCRYYPEKGLPYVASQSVEALKWLAYIGRPRNIVSHAGNGREVRLTGVPNVKFSGYCEETNDVFEYPGCIWHGCPCIPNRHKPIGKTEETLHNIYEETKARLQKIENAGYKFVSIWGCEFRKLLRKKNELCSHHYVRNSPINIRDTFYGVEPKLLKHIAESRKGRRYTM